MRGAAFRGKPAVFGGYRGAGGAADPVRENAPGVPPGAPARIRTRSGADL